MTYCKNTNHIELDENKNESLIRSQNWPILTPSIKLEASKIYHQPVDTEDDRKNNICWH